MSWLAGRLLRTTAVVSPKSSVVFALDVSFAHLSPSLITLASLIPTALTNSSNMAELIPIKFQEHLQVHRKLLLLHAYAHLPHF